MKKKYRTLKVHSKFQRRVFKDITVPGIRLEGKWLRQLGFEEGMQIKVEGQRRKLIITLAKERNKAGLSKGQRMIYQRT
ncbi:MAG: type I addiction module toxin, SymE family [Lewinellaceae bacterium]|nr:type I addiction module toxin, SymE family [Lewinellaceae bacterium]